MSIRRISGVTLALFALSACASQQASHAPAPLKPEAGPKATVRVGYTGGLINRDATAYFRTDEDAYVLVGHLGGDGVIRVLYPESPSQRGRVSANKTNEAEFRAQFDGLPSLFSYSVSQHRSLSSRYDSYDGRGHGYVFIVASRQPISSAVLEENGEWIEWEIADYTRTYDPRYAVRDFAEAIAARGAYTLRFASAFNSSRYDAFASQAWDCSVLSSMGFAYSPFWSSWNYGLFGVRDVGPFGYRCDPYYSAFSHRRYSYTNGGNINRDRYFPVMPARPVTPTTPAPDIDRPDRRGLAPRNGETTRALTASGIGLVKRTTATERPQRTEIIARTPVDRPTAGESRRRQSRDLTTRAAAERRAEPVSRPTRTSRPRAETSETTPRRSEPARTSESPSRSGSRDAGQARGSGGSRDGGRATTSPRDARKPADQQ